MSNPGTSPLSPQGKLRDPLRQELPGGRVIRPLTGRDLQDASDNLLLATISALSPVEDLTPEKAACLLRDMFARGVRPFVIDDGGQLIGFATLVLEPKFGHGGSLAARVEDVSVYPRHQRRGLGKALVCHLRDMALLAGCRKITLSCKSELVGFYIACGFQEAGVAMRYDGKR